MTLNQLLYFQTIARLQHYRNAATQLNVSQPSLSRSMNTLEAELGIMLFEKTGRNITLTKYGKLFLEHVDKILGEVSLAEHKMKQLSGNAGHIDIAYVFPLANYYIPHTVRCFLNCKANENVTFRFQQTRTNEMIADLKRDIYDVVFGSYVENEPSIQFTPIINQELVMITSQNHPLAHRDSLDFRELGNYPIIGYDSDSGMGLHTRRLYQERAISPNIVCDCPDENSIAALVAEDFGIALVTNVDSIRDANICIHPLCGPPIVHTVYMAYLKDKYQIPASQRFIHFIEQTKI